MACIICSIEEHISDDRCVKCLGVAFSVISIDDMSDPASDLVVSIYKFGT